MAAIVTNFHFVTFTIDSAIPIHRAYFITLPSSLCVFIEPAWGAYCAYQLPKNAPCNNHIDNIMYCTYKHKYDMGGNENAAHISGAQLSHRHSNENVFYCLEHFSPRPLYNFLVGGNKWDMYSMAEQAVHGARHVCVYCFYRAQVAPLP